MQETDGFANVTGTLAAAQTRAVTIPFSFAHWSGGLYRNFSPVPSVTVPAGETTFTLRVPIIDNELFEDTDLAVITVPGNATAEAQILIEDDENARGYVGRDIKGIDGKVYYTCRGKGRDILVDDQSGGTIAVQQQGLLVSPPPPGLVVDWDRDQYKVGDTAKITFRTSDGSRVCGDFSFSVYLSQRPRQTWYNELPPQPSSLQFPKGGRMAVTLERGQTEVSRSFRVLAPGGPYFQIARVHNAGGSLIATPAPVDGDGNTLTVSRTLRGAGAATEVSAKTCSTLPCPSPLTLVPVVSMTSAVPVVEGEDVVFTFVAVPQPGGTLDAPLQVGVTIETTGGDYGIESGERTVTIPTTGIATLRLPTDDDDVDDAEGWVSATLKAGAGYALGDVVGSAINILDNDGQLPAAHPVMKYASLVKSFYDRLSAKNQHGDGAAGGWNKRFLKAMGHPDYVAYPQAAVTVADATRIWNHGGDGANTAWDGTVAAVTYAEQYFAGQTPPTPTAQQQVSDPEVTIAAGSGVTEGAGATFTVTADRAPDADLAVTLNVAEAQGSDFVAASDEGARTVTVLAGETSATLTVATDNDGVDEPNGSVTATVQAGTGYTVGTASSGTVAIADDDEPAPQVADNTLPAAHPVMKYASLVKSFYDRLSAKNQHGDGAAGGWNKRFLKAMGHPDYVDYPQAAVTVADATKLWNHGGPGANTAWDGTVAAVTYAEQYFAGQTPPTAQQQQQTPDPEVTIAAGSGVTEGAAATFILTATPSPAAALEVGVTVATVGAFGITAGKRTVTIPTTGSYTLSMATDNDGADEPDGSVTATVDAGDGYTVGAASTGTVAIADDDLPPPAVSVAAGSGVIEGGDAVFTVTADRAVDADLAVALTVSEAAGSDFVAAAGEGNKTVTILAGETSAALTVRTEDDTVDEPDGSVTAALAAGSGYTVASSPKDAASVAVADNDAAGALPVLTVESRSVQEGNRSVIVWATIDPFPSKADFPELYRTTRLKLRTIEGTAWDGVDYVGIPARFGITEVCNFHTTLAPSGKHGCRIDEVTILDDSHDDGGETFQLEVGFADSEPAPLRSLGAARGTVTIENSDPLPAAYLARFGRTVAEQALDGITARMSADRTPGMQGALAGQSLSFDPGGSAQPAIGGVGTGGLLIARGEGEAFGGGSHRFGAGAPADSRPITSRDLLLGSSFTQTGGKDASGGSFAFWGRASQGSFDGVERGDGTDVRLDGSVTTGLLGADYARDRWLVGLALARSSADGAYTAIGGGGERPGAGDGKVESSLTAAIPYASAQVSERLKLWGALGYGAGEVTLKTAKESLEADTTWSMAAAGLRGGLLKPEGRGFALALLADALWTRTDSDEAGGLSASASEANRLRLGVEGSREFTLGGGVVTPRVELGVRHDGGDAETGFGVEVGGGVSLTAERLGLVLDVSGRALLAHEAEDFRDRGISASLTYDPDPGSKRGASFALRRDLGGSAAGGLDALFASDPLAKRAGGRSDGWRAEAAWGLPAFGGRFTGSPFLAWGFSAGARDYDVGWRLEPEASGAPDLSLALKATRREAVDDTTDHGFGVDLTARW